MPLANDSLSECLRSRFGLEVFSLCFCFFFLFPSSASSAIVEDRANDRLVPNVRSLSRWKMIESLVVSRSFTVSSCCMWSSSW